MAARCRPGKERPTWLYAATSLQDDETISLTARHHVFMVCFLGLWRLIVRHLGVLGRWTLALLCAAALVFSASVVAEGWRIFLSHGGSLDLGYLNKRLSIGLLVWMPCGVAYFLAAYGAFSRVWRRDPKPTTVRAIFGNGALAGALPALMVAAMGGADLAPLPIGLGALLFGLLRFFLSPGATAQPGAPRGKHVLFSFVFAGVVGLAFTLWAMGELFRQDMQGDSDFMTGGGLDYGRIALVSTMWFVASAGAAVGVYWLGVLLGWLGHRLARSIQPSRL